MNDLQTITKTWVDAMLEYYKNTPDRSSLTQIFARGYFAGWSERELALFVDRLKWNNDNFPPWPTNNNG